MQFQVPQFIETEDRLVGPLTLRQFIYVAIAAAISFVMFFVLATWLWFIITIFLAGVSLGLAFIKINGQPLLKIIAAAFKFYWQPQTFVWQSEAPNTPRARTRETQIPASKPSVSIEDVMAGMALRKTWQRLQTATPKATEPVREATRKIKERYQIFEKITGERQAARRVDYR